MDDFVTISDDAAKNYKLKIIEANLHARKMTLNDDEVPAIDKPLLSSPASYPYLETIAKTFLVPTGSQSWKQEDVFSREPIQRFAICIKTNEAFNLEQICINQIGLPAADNPINTFDGKRLYFNTMSYLAYTDNGHGNKLSERPSNFDYGV